MNSLWVWIEMRISLERISYQKNHPYITWSQSVLGVSIEGPIRSKDTLPVNQ